MSWESRNQESKKLCHSTARHSPKQAETHPCRTVACSGWGRVEGQGAVVPALLGNHAASIVLIRPDINFRIPILLVHEVYIRSCRISIIISIGAFCSNSQPQHATMSSQSQGCSLLENPSALPRGLDTRLCWVAGKALKIHCHIPKPYCLLHIHIMVIQLEFLISYPVW